MKMTVDFAAKFSAVMVRDGGEVLAQFDSRNTSAMDFIHQIGRTARRYDPEVILVEDVPYGISSQAMTKPVLRLQGFLIYVLIRLGYSNRTVFVNPSTWQKMFPGVARGKPEDRIEAARVAALERGYEAPDLVARFINEQKLINGEKARILKKDTAPLAKTMTDYVDAFLMQEWLDHYTLEELLSGMPGCQPIFI